MPRVVEYHPTERDSQELLHEAMRLAEHANDTQMRAWRDSLTEGERERLDQAVADVADWFQKFSAWATEHGWGVTR